jgi:hypothetical protein
MSKNYRQCEGLDRPLLHHPLQSGDGIDPLCHREDGSFHWSWE